MCIRDRYIDTEFVRRTTFYPQLGLLQISDGETHCLVDPTTITEWQPLKTLFEDERIVKVMHSASEDIDVFASAINAVPKPLFDTQIACGLAGVGAGLGFAKMVEHFTGTVLDKGETTSDWLARPLTEKQCQYAVADVALLSPCYLALKDTLADQQRLAWVMEDSQRLIDKHVCFWPAEAMYTRVKGIGRVSPSKLVYARAIAAWREEQAKKLDRPRSRVLKDSDLIAIAKRQPQHIAQIPQSDSLGHGWLKRFGEQVLSVIQQASEESNDNWPSPIKELNSSQKQRLNALRDSLVPIAEKLAIESSALASKKDLQTLVVPQSEQAELFQGWRQQALAPMLAQVQTANVSD